MAHLNIVLHEPEIPANTGNFGRTCVATGTRLHLIKPLGFDISDKAVKRAGLDYWPKLDVTVYESYEDFLERNPGGEDLLCDNEGAADVCGCALRGRLLHHVRKRKRRNPGRHSVRQPGDSSADSDD